jgi:transposase
VSAALPEAVQAANTPIEVWHQDEARVGQQGSLTYVWAEKGSRPAAPRDLGYQWAYLFGAVCAERGVGAALVLPDANTHAMNLHLAEISRSVASGAHGLVVLDGAGWHQTGGRLHVPHNISLLHLPPYSPELNPVENVWAYLRQNQLSNRVFNTYDAIVDACCTAWNALVAMPDRIRSIATRAWTKTVNA